MQSICLYFALLCLVLGNQPTEGPQTPDSGERAPPKDAKQIAADLFNETGESGSNPPLPRLPGAAAIELDDETRAAYLEALRGYYRYTIEGQDHRSMVFSWQFYSSIVIFFVMVFLVSVGVYFSWVQFRQDVPRGNRLRGTSKEGESSPDATAGRSETTIKATPSGIEVSSPVLGVIILALSLAFFYLYLVYVYPVVETF